MRVSIDAGHGGHDQRGRSSPFGVRGPGGTTEKEVTLRLAERVAAHLGPISALTRTGDINLSLAERIDIARRNGSSVLVSLHANAGPPGRRGAESWVHSRAGASSHALAQSIQRKLGRFGGPNHGVKEGDLALLTPERLGPGISACIVEVDFLSDARGERRLRDPAQIDALGRAIARGVHGFLDDRSGRRAAYGRAIAPAYPRVPGRPSPYAEAEGIMGATIGSLPSVPTGAPWTDLISFRLSSALQRAINDREPTAVTNLWHIHKIEDGRGPINLDRYEIDVATLPTLSGAAVTAEELLEHIRLNINSVVDPSIAKFSPYDATIDEPVWTSASPLGAVVHIAMTDDGSVICSRQSSDHWIFSTLKTGADGFHPVSGNRQFGFTRRGDGYVFFTRGADRASGAEFWAAGDVVFEGGDSLWKSFQKGVADLVNTNGGSAAVGSRFSQRFDWDEIQAAYHRPSTSWI